MDETDPTVLVVDDESELLDVYQLWLDDECTVRTADGGAAALEAVDESVDVAFLDRRMPEMSGDEVLQEFRSQGFDLQVAMLTAVEPETDVVEMGFDDYLTKPVKRTDLLSTIDVLLQREEYDDRSQELFTLASKKAALEASPEVDHNESAEYADLVERLETIREEVDTTLDELVEHDYEAAFQQL